MNQKEIKLIKQYNIWANIMILSLGCIFIMLAGMIISISIPGIIFDRWNDQNSFNVMTSDLIIVSCTSGILIIILAIIAFKKIIATKKIHNIFEKISVAQEKSNNINPAGIIAVNHLATDTIGKGKNNIGNGLIDMMASFAIAKKMKYEADILVSYLPEDQKPKKINFNIIFVIVAILSIVPLFLGIIASLKDKEEVIYNREETITAIKDVYQDYNPNIDKYYNYYGYYEDTVEIKLNDDSIIVVEMYKGGQGKITNIRFIALEKVSDINDTEIIIDNLLKKTETLYQRTNQFKEYYKEIFRNQTPPYKMDEVHRKDLVEKLNEIVYNGRSNYIYQEQYSQYRDNEPKTSVDQMIRLQVEKKEQYEISLVLNIEERKLPTISPIDRYIRKRNNKYALN